MASTTVVPFFFPDQILGAASADLTAAVVTYDQDYGAVYSINVPGCDGNNDSNACSYYNGLVITENSDRVAYATTNAAGGHRTVVCTFDNPDDALCTFGFVSSGTLEAEEMVIQSVPLSPVTVTAGLDQLPSSATGNIFDNIVYTPQSGQAMTGSTAKSTTQATTATASSARPTTASTAATSKTVLGAAKPSSATSSGPSGASTSNAGVPAATAAVSLGGAMAALFFAVAAM